jgi:carbon-monoxide dehydrogenase iron sulfur subunit
MPEEKEKEFATSRRKFLKGLGIGAATGVATLIGACQEQIETPEPTSTLTPAPTPALTATPEAAVAAALHRTIPVAQKVIVADPSICRGCATCVAACSLYHTGQCSRTVSSIEIARDFLLGQFVQNVCRQCEGPECMLACPVEGAMYVDTSTGARSVDQSKCLGCGRCVDACQFNAVKLDIKREVAVKCDLCGGDPQCVAVCPTGALAYQDWKPGD